MKYLVLLAIGISFALAAPKAKNDFKFKNLFVEAIKINTDRKQSPRIIGGHEAQPHSIPYQALLMSYSGSSGWYCEGILFKENAVLTAATCTADADEIEVILGAHEFRKPEDTQVLITTRNFKIHENYSYDPRGSVNDISIVILPAPVKLNSAISVISLPKSSGNLYIGSNGRVSGWGFTSSSSSDMSEVLNYADVPVISNDECLKNLNVLDSNLCTSGVSGKGSCDGDAGGPLVVDGLLVGIVSFQIEGCPTGAPTAYTRVTSFLDWIAANSH